MTKANFFLVLGTKAKFLAGNLTLWETGKGKSYMCNKETTINNGGMELTVSKVQYQAFKTETSTDFGGTLIVFISRLYECIYNL